jgi:uncharacterized protein YecE (DUF72 family)
VTTDFVYIRGHGPTGEYHSQYSPRTLSKWAADVKKWKRQGLDVYAYFDNDQKSAAPKDAKRLVGLLTKARAKS